MINIIKDQTWQPGLSVFITTKSYCLLPSKCNLTHSANISQLFIVDYFVKNGRVLNILNGKTNIKTIFFRELLFLWV